MSTSSSPAANAKYSWRETPQRGLPKRSARERIADFITRQQDMYRYIHDQAVRLVPLHGEARVSVPMHYGTFPILEQSADRFVAEVARIAPQTRVVVLKPGESAGF